MWALENIYRNFLNKDFYECLKNNDFPVDAFFEEDEEEYGGVLAKKSMAASKKKIRFYIRENSADFCGNS